jgi:hypothetical protein
MSVTRSYAYTNLLGISWLLLKCSIKQKLLDIQTKLPIIHCLSQVVNNKKMYFKELSQVVLGELGNYSVMTNYGNKHSPWRCGDWLH